MVVQKRGGADRERTRKILAVELNFVCMLRGGRDTRRAAEPAMCRLCCPQRAGSKRKSGRASGCEWRRETAWMEAAQWRDRRQQATRRATGRCTAWSCASRAGVGTSCATAPLVSPCGRVHAVSAHKVAASPAATQWPVSSAHRKRAREARANARGAATRALAAAAEADLAAGPGRAAAATGAAPGR